MIARFGGQLTVTSSLLLTAGRSSASTAPVFVILPHTVPSALTGIVTVAPPTAEMLGYVHVIFWPASAQVPTPVVVGAPLLTMMSGSVSVTLALVAGP